ncbi:SPOR domain-containing protein [Gemmobacter sp. 24YEA27]|uniref:SPOR domain-containing protein n=1 Tax=Gemmobacter sp. 24YEA27 TaxID=3040672 RepID=UPI0024B38A65|nr:SPOR domain-containing protein [Gemmobacter sp. 24YEA27]
MANADFGDYGGYASQARPGNFSEAAPMRPTRIGGAQRGGFQAARAQSQPQQPQAAMARRGAFQAYDDHDGYAAQSEPQMQQHVAPQIPLTRGQRMVNMAGALGSVALVLSLGYWGWELAVRDVRGVPVVRALEGPMRTAPEEGGGMVVDHQGLAVNDVAARDGGKNSDRVVLAPAPVDLAADDVAGLALASAAPAVAPLAPAMASAGTVDAPRMSAAEESPLPLEVSPDQLPAAPVLATESQPATISQDEAVALALAEALGMDETASADLVAAAAPAAAPAAPGAMTSSPRPRMRPSTLAATGGSAAGTPENVMQTAAVASAPSGAGKDPATIEAGARLVQFGAYDSEAQARAEWQKIAARLGPLMVEKQMVVQSAESGGHTFWRLRGFGFASEDDARRFCSAAVAEQINCIPVTHR